MDKEPLISLANADAFYRIRVIVSVTRMPSWGQRARRRVAGRVVGKQVFRRIFK